MNLSPEDLAVLKNIKGTKKSTSSAKGKDDVPPVQFNLNSKLPPPKADRGKTKESVPLNTKNHAYDDLDSITVSMAAQPKVWKDQNMSSINIFDVNRLTPVNAILVGKEILDAIREEKFTAKHAELSLTLATSLYKPGRDMENPVFLLHQPPAEFGRAIGTASGNSSSDGAKVDTKLSRQLNTTRTKIQRTSDEDKLVELRKLETKLLEKMNAAEATGTKAITADDAEDAAAWAYFGAYLMRLSAKTEEAWIEKLSTAVTRFKTWYDSETEILDDMDITAEMARKVRESFSKRPECVSTWVMWVAYNENENKNMNVNETGMMKYLAIQMFSYTGLHAYSFIAQIQIEHNVSFKHLLNQLHCAHTKKAVEEVANIIRNYEVTEVEEKRKTYFRYARVWDTGYFLNLQTSNCKMLAYVVAKTKKMLSSNAAGADPTQVFALRNLDVKMKTTLDAVADNLYDFIVEAATQDDMAGPIWKIKG